MDINDILRQVAVSAPPILVAITFHEVAHGLAAYRLGDGTARAQGRLTLNPLAHIDPIGTVLLPIMLLIFSGGKFTFGYAKPVPINPYNFKNPRKGMAISAAAGPLMNLALAVVSVILLKLFLIAGAAIPESVYVPLRYMLLASIMVNVVLAAFNLIPIPPLDGGRIMVGLLPREWAFTLDKLEPYGMIIVIILLATGLSDLIVSPLINFFLALLSIL